MSLCCSNKKRQFVDYLPRCTFCGGIKPPFLNILDYEPCHWCLNGTAKHTGDKFKHIEVKHKQHINLFQRNPCICRLSSLLLRMWPADGLHHCEV